MKILTFTDLHGDMEILKELKPKSKETDFTIFAGDLTFFGENLQKLLEELNKFHNKVLLIHGNHEDKEEMQELCKDFSNLEFISDKSYRINNYLIFGYGDNGFSKKDKPFLKFAKKWAKEIKKDDTTILVSHGPPFETKQDLIFEEVHSGSIPVRDFLLKNKIDLCITGHIHENEGTTDKVGECTVINPGIESITVEFN